MILLFAWGFANRTQSAQFLAEKQVHLTIANTAFGTARRGRAFCTGPFQFLLFHHALLLAGETICFNLAILHVYTLSRKNKTIKFLGCDQRT